MRSRTIKARPGSKPVNGKLSWDPIVPLKLYLDNAPSALQPYIREALHNFSEGHLESGIKLLKRIAVPEFWDSAEDYRAAAQAAALVVKIPFPSNSRQRKLDAMEQYQRTERRCKFFNKKLRHYFGHWNRMPDDIRVVLSRARANVDRVLGELTEPVLDRILMRAHFGKGMSQSSADASKTTICYKLLDTVTITPAAVPYFQRLLQNDHHWTSLLLDEGKSPLSISAKLVDHSRVTFVPKDALRLRSIAIEPAINVALQLGCHDVLAYRLARVAGIDISDQSVNQSLAQVGAETWMSQNPWCTIDLSNASDLLCKELVKGLLPSSWYHLFSDLRTQHFLLPGGEICRAEKFSSMGNGFTFALQTLVFWALAQACSSLTEESNPRAFAYGDDIIVRRSCYLLLVEVLRFVGLEINLSKSFAFGPFRESCGEDWFGGTSVRPVYIRDYSLKESDGYRFSNRFRTAKLYTISAYFRERIPESARLYAPFLSCPDDSAIHVSFELARSLGRKVKWINEYQAWSFTVLRFKPRNYHMNDYVKLVAWLRARPSSEELMTEGLVVTRRDRGKWRLGKVIF